MTGITKVTNTPELTIGFIVNNDLSHIGHALESLKTTQLALRTLILIKTSISEETLQDLQTRFPEGEFLVNQNTQNNSFSNNHNFILKQTTTPFIALLNDDIEIHDTALDTMVTYLKEHPTVALVGPQLLNSDGSLQVSQYSHPSLWRVLYKISGLARLTHQHSTSRQLLKRLNLISLDSFQTFETATSVDVIKGTAMVVRQAAIEDIGLLDETFELYVEEFDWQWRLEIHGWKRVIVPDAKITHYGTSQAELRLFGRRLREDRRSMLNYFIKHRPTWQVIIVRLAMILSHTFWGLFWWLWNHDRSKVHFEIMRIGCCWRRPT